MKFCAAPGCPVKVEGGRCEKHRQEQRTVERRYYTTPIDRARRPQHDDRYYPPINYGRRWQRIARKHLFDHPFCVECQKAGKTTLATQCDHVVPHRGDPQLFWDPENRQGLCVACHSRKTAIEVGLGRTR